MRFLFTPVELGDSGGGSPAGFPSPAFAAAALVAAAVLALYGVLQWEIHRKRRRMAVAPAPAPPAGAIFHIGVEEGGRSGDVGRNHGSNSSPRRKSSGNSNSIGQCGRRAGGRHGRKMCREKKVAAVSSSSSSNTLSVFDTSLLDYTSLLILIILGMLSSPAIHAFAGSSQVTSG